MRLRWAARRQDRRSCALVRGQGAGRDVDRNRPDRSLPARAFGLQGAEGRPLPRCPAKIECGQDPPQGSARPAIGAAMTTAQYSMANAALFAGHELGASKWVTLDQDRIDVFAACTGDRQWIHVDVE